MSLLAVKRMTIIFASSMLLLQPAIVFSADQPGATPAPVVTPAPALQTSAEIKVPANIKYKKAKGTLNKKGGFTTGAPSMANVANDNYLNLGPNGTSTPICPADSSRCPDVNSMSGLVILSPATIALVCPDVCSVTRTGTLDDGDAPVVCPAGYSQLVAYNVKKEWVKNPGGGAATPVPVPTNDFATYQTYWHDYQNYHCTGKRRADGVPICVPYGNQGPGPPQRETDGRDYDVVYMDQPCTKGSWGMNNNGDAPYARLNPAVPADRRVSIDGYYNSAIEAQAGVSALFNQIRAEGYLPAVWASFDNATYPNPAGARWGNWYDPQTQSQYKSAGFPDGCQTVPAYDVDYGYWSDHVDASSEMKTYLDAACTRPARAHADCGNGGYGGPEHYQQTNNFSGSCQQLYVRIQIPVHALYCERLKKPVLKETGMPAPTSLICGRVKGSWE